MPGGIQFVTKRRTKLSKVAKVKQNERQLEHFSNWQLLIIEWKEEKKLQKGNCDVRVTKAKIINITPPLTRKKEFSLPNKTVPTYPHNKRKQEYQNKRPSTPTKTPTSISAGTKLSSLVWCDAARSCSLRSFSGHRTRRSNTSSVGLKLRHSCFASRAAKSDQRLTVFLK